MCSAARRIKVKRILFVTPCVLQLFLLIRVNAGIIILHTAQELCVRLVLPPPPPPAAFPPENEQSYPYSHDRRSASVHQGRKGSRPPVKNRVPARIISAPLFITHILSGHRRQSPCLCCFTVFTAFLRLRLKIPAPTASTVIPAGIAARYTPIQARSASTAEL